MRYEYICDNCENKVEYNLKVDDRDKHVGKNCTLCTGGVLRRSLGNSGGFRLLGGGWESDAYSSHVGDTPQFKKTGQY